MEGTPTRTTRERRRERTKAVILQAAEELLSEGGLPNATIANIAHRAAYSKPAIYEYFSGLEAILFDLANDGFIRLGKRVRAVPRDLPPDERMVLVCRAILEFAAENPGLYQLMFTHIIFTGSPPEMTQPEDLEQTEAAYLTAAETIQDGLDQGIFKTRPGFDKTAMLYLCWTTVHGMASLKRKLLEEIGLDVQQYQEETFRILVHNLKGTVPEA